MPFLELYHEAGQWAAATVFEAVQQTLEETLPCLLGHPQLSPKCTKKPSKPIFKCPILRFFRTTIYVFLGQT